MKLTRSKLRKLIKEEVTRLVEMQVGLGLSHNFSNEELYKHTLNFVSANPSLVEGTPEYEKAEGLLSILNNRVVQAVQHSQYETTPEDTEYMREIQGKLKMVRVALLQAMDHIDQPDARYKSWQQGRRDDFRRQSEEFDEKGISKYSSDRPYYIRKRYR